MSLMKSLRLGLAKAGGAGLSGHAARRRRRKFQRFKFKLSHCKRFCASAAALIIHRLAVHRHGLPTLFSRRTV